MNVIAINLDTALILGVVLTFGVGTVFGGLIGYLVGKS